MKQQYIKISKFLSYVLRHKPEAIGITLNESGWVDVDRLLHAMRDAGNHVTREILDEVVRTNDKKRFAFSDDGKKIRASQGHSIQIELGLTPVVPPKILYHGTATRFLEAILSSGLRPQGRQYVHLSPDEHTAIRVGQRHGIPVILSVEAGAMHADGHQFFLSANGVWLTSQVPQGYLRVLSSLSETKDK